MAKCSSSAAGRKATSKSKKEKRPRRDFPLSYHLARGRLYKTLRGKRYYFGHVQNRGGWEAAEAEFERAWPDVNMGLQPPERPKPGEASMRELCNAFQSLKTGQAGTGRGRNVCLCPAVGRIGGSESWVTQSPGR